MQKMRQHGPVGRVTDKDMIGVLFLARPLPHHVVSGRSFLLPVPLLSMSPTHCLVYLPCKLFGSGTVPYCVCPCLASGMLSLPGVLLAAQASQAMVRALLPAALVTTDKPTKHLGWAAVYLLIIDRHLPL